MRKGYAESCANEGIKEHKKLLKCAEVTHSSLLLGDVLVVMYLILYVPSFKIVTIS